jgi:hypothetical protein
LGPFLGFSSSYRGCPAAFLLDSGAGRKTRLSLGFARLRAAERIAPVKRPMSEEHLAAWGATGAKWPEFVDFPVGQVRDIKAQWLRHGEFRSFQFALRLWPAARNSKMVQFD